MPNGDDHEPEKIDYVQHRNETRRAETVSRFIIGFLFGFLVGYGLFRWWDFRIAFIVGIVFGILCVFFGDRFLDYM